jgi:hypothetical protein
MASVFIDTGVWIAAIAKRDSHYQDAKKIIEWIDQQSQYRIVVTNLILAEVANFLMKKKYLQYARALVDLFNDNVKIDLYYDDETISRLAIDLFKRSDRLSYVDANSVVFCRQLNCDYLISFDSDFDGIEKITRIEQPPEISE